MPFIFAFFGRIISIGLFLIGGFLLITKLLGKPKDQVGEAPNGNLEGFLMPKKPNSSFQTKPETQSANSRFENELRASKEAQREKKRRFSRIDNAWKLASIGVGLLVGGLALDVSQNAIGPIGLGILAAAIVGWIGAYINNYIHKQDIAKSAIIVPPRTPINAPTVLENALPDGRTQLINGVLQEAAVALNSLDEIVPRLRTTNSVSTVSQIVIVGKRLMNSVADNPEKFAIAQRVFTYYCPEALGVGEALAKMENAPNPDIARITSTLALLQKLSILFERTELELRADDDKSLDIDLKLLDQSLQADLSVL